MIPKVIHICWLSGDPFPEDIAKCLVSWKSILQDYEIWLWGKKPVDCLGLNVIEKSFNLNSVPWCKQAFEAKKYAFAADYIRLYAVYNYGGIYMDSDVMMFKPFDDLLNLPYFLGEDAVHCFEPAIFGAEKNCAWLKVVLDRYDKLEFVNKDSSLNMEGLPLVFHNQLFKKFEFELTPKGTYIYKGDIIRIFPKEYFNSRNYIKPIHYKESYCSHHFVGSWLNTSNKSIFKVLSKRLVPNTILNIIYAALIRTIYRKNLKKIQIPYLS